MSEDLIKGIRKDGSTRLRIKKDIVEQLVEMAQLENLSILDVLYTAVKERYIREKIKASTETFSQASPNQVSFEQTDQEQPPRREIKRCKVQVDEFFDE